MLEVSGTSNNQRVTGWSFGVLSKPVPIQCLNNALSTTNTTPFAQWLPPISDRFKKEKQSIDGSPSLACTSVSVFRSYLRPLIPNHCQLPAFGDYVAAPTLYPRLWIGSYPPSAIYHCLVFLNRLGSIPGGASGTPPTLVSSWESSLSPSVSGTSWRPEPTPLSK